MRETFAIRTRSQPVDAAACDWARAALEDYVIDQRFFAEVGRRRDDEDDKRRQRRR